MKWLPAGGGGGGGGVEWPQVLALALFWKHINQVAMRVMSGVGPFGNAFKPASQAFLSRHPLLLAWCTAGLPLLGPSWMEQASRGRAAEQRAAANMGKGRPCRRSQAANEHGMHFSPWRTAPPADPGWRRACPPPRVRVQPNGCCVLVSWCAPAYQ